MKVFISSTAIDLEEHKMKAKDAILRLEHQPVIMNDFGANPISPVDLCKMKIKGCDAFVLIVAHRYGWVPTLDQGGDGQKSITWIEFETAIELKKQVFAYLVDEKAEWTNKKEQDLIVTANPEEYQGIIDRVVSLKKFKDYINASPCVTRDTFSNPSDLGSKIAADLGREYALITSGIRNTDAAKWEIRYIHRLMPALHFKGRNRILDDLLNWWNDVVSSDRLISLVAMGGVGKTAILAEFLERIKKSELHGDIFVWSFYDDANIESFFFEACKFFGRILPEDVSASVGELCQILQEQNLPRLFILDGLERLQSDGKHMSRNKGSIEDTEIKNFFLTIVNGIGSTKVLVTSRFNLIDLSSWDGLGYRLYNLEVLDVETAIEVLKAWGVKGSKAELSDLAESVGNHALSVAVLAAYLCYYGNCDPKNASQFKLSEMSADYTLAARLEIVLEQYSKCLPNDERELLRLLSVFSDGVSEDSLVHLAGRFGVEIVGPLKGIKKIDLKKTAHRLSQQGLIFNYAKGDREYYIAHPFLRDYFSKNLIKSREKIHKEVALSIKLDLEGKPGIRIRSNAILDDYEAMINHLISGKDFESAYDVYKKKLDNNEDSSRGLLFYELNDYSRISRIISKFSKTGTPGGFTDKLSGIQKCELINDWGLATLALGDLKLATSCFNMVLAIEKKNNDRKNIAVALQNLALVSINRGLFIEAKEYLDSSLSYNEQVLHEEFKDYESTYKNDHEYLGFVYHCLGDITLSNRFFSTASDSLSILKNRSGQQYFAHEFFEILHNIDIGELALAREKAENSLQLCETLTLERERSLCLFCLGLVSLDSDIKKANDCLSKIKKWSTKSGYVETKINAYILSARLSLQIGNIQAAERDAKSGLNLANTSGYLKHSIDLRIILASIYMKYPDFKLGLQMARKAHEISVEATIKYKWGEANALHLLAEIYYNLGQKELALKTVEEAILVRKNIAHPELQKTQTLLLKIAKENN